MKLRDGVRTASTGQSAFRRTFQEIAQLFFAFREESLAKLAINIRRRHKRRIRVSPQLDHMLNEQLGSILLSQRRRISVGPDRELREINRAEDTFNIDRRHVLSMSRHALV